MKLFTSFSILADFLHISSIFSHEFSSLTEDFFHPRRLNFKHERRKRYSIEGSLWDVRKLTYRISQPTDSMPFWQQKEVFRKAFEVWSEYSILSFEYREYGPVHIDIIFVRGNHGDGEPFDGKGKILAHAYFPRYGGDLHIDDDEFWSPDKNDDISGLDRLYGKRETKLSVTEIKQRNLPNLCKKPFVNAVTRVHNGSIYVFQGKYYWELGSAGPLPGYPKEIAAFWGIEGPLDAAMTNNQGLTYIFKGSQYWVFSPSLSPMTGYPRDIQKGLQDTPSNLDAVFIHHMDNKPYFIKKDKIWPYSRFGMANGYPISIKSIFDGKPPSHIDAAFRFDQYATYIFSDDKYWKLTDTKELRTQSGYPRSISSNWFNCK